MSYPAELSGSEMKIFKRKKKHFVLLILAAVAIVYFALLINYSASAIDSKKNATLTVDIPTGSGFLKITEILNDAGLIKSRILFYSLALTKRAMRSIRAGEYEFNSAMTPSMMIDRLLRGEIKTYRVTIPEDFSVKEIAARLMEYKLIDEEDFFSLADDEDFLNSLGIKTESIEGYLFPDTYLLDRSMSTRQIMKLMVNRFWKKVTPEMIKRAEEIGFNLNELITLSSIIGKESGANSEKTNISAVFHNRLRKKMRLQSDPTAVYDLDKFKGKVLKSHLRRNSPYNTYVITGLPPGPIANPGIDSIKAALYPAAVNYLYFVSKNDGTHFFSPNLEMHNQAIYQYRLSKNKEIKMKKQ
jgi:UPF0755 protein